MRIQSVQMKLIKYIDYLGENKNFETIKEKNIQNRCHKGKKYCIYLIFFIFSIKYAS